MIRLITYLLGKGIVTNQTDSEFLDENVVGLPRVTEAACKNGCSACVQQCPTKAIKTLESTVELDRGACIACSLCIEECPSGTLVNDVSIDVCTYNRSDLRMRAGNHKKTTSIKGNSIFGSSLSLRVVSTGCSSCDLEVIAAGNPIFDMERLGINVVASPRFADALLITGPVPKAMHAPLESCYKAMASPKIVIACGTCAVSGGLHANGYAEANGASAILPVDVFIPGCPPHPLQIIRGIQAARKLKV